LAIGHAHAASGLDYGAIHAFNSSVGIANQGQQRVEGESQDCEPVGTSSDPGSGQQESEEREAGDSLNDVGSAEDGFVQRGPAGNQNTERDSNQDREESGSAHQPQVLQRKLQDFGVIVQHKLPDVHGFARLGISGVPKAAT